MIICPNRAAVGTHLISSQSVITEEVRREARAKGRNRVKYPEGIPEVTHPSIIFPVSIAFITVVSMLSLFCSVIWDQFGGVSSKQTWIRTFIMAQLDSLPTPSSHTPKGRLQRKLWGWRCRLLSHWGLHHSILFTIHIVSSMWEVIMRHRETVAQTWLLCIGAKCIPQSDLWTFSLKHSAVLLFAVYDFVARFTPWTSLWLLKRSYESS